MRSLKKLISTILFVAFLVSGVFGPQYVGYAKGNDKKDTVDRGDKNARVKLGKTTRFIVKYKDDKGREDVKSTLKSNLVSSKKLKSKKNKNVDVITTDKITTVEEFKKEIRNKKLDANIEYIVADDEVKLESNDTYFNQQWGIYSAPTVPQSVYSSAYGTSADGFRSDINVVDAWNITQGAGAVVGVIDTGVDISHEDLSANIWTNPGEIPGNGIDDDGNGYIDDITGWDFCEDDNSVHNAAMAMAYDEQHGTHVAGIIAAVKDNGKGITGVAPQAKVMPLKAFKNGTAFTSDIIEAVEYAEAMGIKVLNCSWGTATDNVALKEVIENSNMLFVCAAGNNGVNIDVNPVYPAAYTSDNIISVASVNKDGALSSFSNYGVNSVDVAAPGEGIFSTLPNNGYGYMSGTSMAAPFVSGEAALVKCVYGNDRLSFIKDKVVNTCNRNLSLQNKVFNSNEISCVNAVYQSQSISLYSPVGFYQSTVDFSSTRGSNGWYYVEKTANGYTEMTWDGTIDVWKGSTPNGMIARDWMHPDEKDSARKWVAPLSGNIVISSNGNIRKYASGGDGVKVRVYKNSSLLWEKNIEGTDVSGISFPAMNVEVAAGDSIYFEVNMNGDFICDAIVWDPIIEYKGPYSYQSAVDFSSTRGSNGWYYVEKTASGYSEMTWDGTIDVWKGSTPNGMIARDWMHPDEKDSARKWVAPLSGNIVISSNGNIRKYASGGDGVKVRVYKNSSLLWEKNIEGTDVSGISFPAMNVEVAAGDSIYFEVNMNGDFICDAIVWDPIIEYKGPYSYQSAVDFSSTRGSNGWYYVEKTASGYSEMTWDGTIDVWKGSTPNGMIARDWMHPDTTDSVRKWVAPLNGNIVISSNGNIRKYSSGGDGVKVRLYKNGGLLWEKYIAGTDVAGISFPATSVKVSAGDAIYFEVNMNGDFLCDATIWNPIIEYKGPYRYQSTVDFSSTRGSDGWYYVEKTASGYSEMTWDGTIGVWKGSTPNGMIARDWMHPDVMDSARKWVAPLSGNIVISSNGNIRKYSSGGDGVKVRLYKNGGLLWEKYIAGTDVAGISFPAMSVEVSAGDAIYFEVNMNGDFLCDATIWDTIIEYKGLNSTQVALTQTIPGTINIFTTKNLYRVNIPQTGVLSADLNITSGSSYYTVNVYDSSNSLIRSINNWSQTNRKFMVDAQTPGDYYIEVVNTYGQSLSYTLQVNRKEKLELTQVSSSDTNTTLALKVNNPRNIKNGAVVLEYNPTYYTDVSSVASLPFGGFTGLKTIAMKKIPGTSTSKAVFYYDMEDDFAQDMEDREVMIDHLIFTKSSAQGTSTVTISPESYIGLYDSSKFSLNNSTSIAVSAASLQSVSDTVYGKVYEQPQGNVEFKVFSKPSEQELSEKALEFIKSYTEDSANIVYNQVYTASNTTSSTFTVASTGDISTYSSLYDPNSYSDISGFVRIPMGSGMNPEKIMVTLTDKATSANRYVFADRVGKFKFDNVPADINYTIGVKYTDTITTTANEKPIFSSVDKDIGSVDGEETMFIQDIGFFYQFDFNGNGKMNEADEAKGFFNEIAKEPGVTDGNYLDSVSSTTALSDNSSLNLDKDSEVNVNDASSSISGGTWLDEPSNPGTVDKNYYKAYYTEDRPAGFNYDDYLLTMPTEAAPDQSGTFSIAFYDWTVDSGITEDYNRSKYEEYFPDDNKYYKLCRIDSNSDFVVNSISAPKSKKITYSNGEIMCIYVIFTVSYTISHTASREYFGVKFRLGNNTTMKDGFGIPRTTMVHNTDPYQGTGNSVSTTVGGKTITLINAPTSETGDPEQSTGTNKPVALTIGETDIESATLKNGVAIANFYDLAYNLGTIVVGRPGIDSSFEIQYRRPDGGLGIKTYTNADLIYNSDGTYSFPIMKMANDLEYTNRITNVKHSDNSQVIFIEKEDDGLDWFNSISSMVFGFIPGVGDAKDWQEVVTGYDIITGDTLSTGERCITLACAFLPVINGAVTRVGKKGVTTIDNAVNASKRLDDVANANFRKALWEFKPTVRGQMIEKYLAKYDYDEVTTGWRHIGKEMNGYFPVIDFWKGNEVVSLKSIDPRLYSGSGATNKLLEYLENLEETRFIVSDYGGANPVELANFNKTLDIRVPAGTSNLIDLSYLNGFANNVKIVLKEF